MTDMSMQEITEKLIHLPQSIYGQEQIVIVKRNELRQSELDLDREFSKHFQAAKIIDLKDAEAKQVAMQKIIENGWRGKLIAAHLSLETSEILLRKLQNEYVSVRKIASLKNEELRMAGR